MNPTVGHYLEELVAFQIKFKMVCIEILTEGEGLLTFALLFIFSCLYMDAQSLCLTSSSHSDFQEAVTCTGVQSINN